LSDEWQELGLFADRMCVLSVVGWVYLVTWATAVSWGVPYATPASMVVAGGVCAGAWRVWRRRGCR
jgi:hypothetical protein